MPKLRNGAVLPHGLLSETSTSAVAGFNKTYKNHALKAGIVIKSYGIDDKGNKSKLAPEYDVLVVEQDENRAVVPITYFNCLSAEGLGSIADYFETRIREQKSSSKSKGKDFKGQDGAIVLMLCLDGVSEKAIIVGGLTHPDRKTKLVGKGQILAGEFNGLAIAVADDGSANLTFKGATDNKGKPKDSSQGNTTIDIEKDGSVQFKHKGVTQRMEKKGKFLLKTEDSTTVEAKKEITLKTEDNFNLKATKDAAMEMVALAIKASGSATLSMASLSIKSEGEVSLEGQQINVKGSMLQIDAGSMAQIKSSQITLQGLTFIGGAGGLPALLPTTQFIGIGNLGIPVVSTAIGAFATKTFVT